VPIFFSTRRRLASGRPIRMMPEFASWLRDCKVVAGLSARPGRCTVNQHLLLDFAVLIRAGERHGAPLRIILDCTVAADTMKGDFPLHSLTFPGDQRA